MTQDNNTFEASVERVFAFIQSYCEAHKLPPTQREIAAACHLSKGSVTRCLDVLEARGRLKREPGLPRTIRLFFPEEEVGQTSEQTAGQTSHTEQN